MSVPAHGTRDQVVPVLPMSHWQLTVVQHDPRRGLVTEDPVEKAGHPKIKIGRLMAPQKIRTKIKPAIFTLSIFLAKISFVFHYFYTLVRSRTDPEQCLKHACKRRMKIFQQEKEGVICFAVKIKGGSLARISTWLSYSWLIGTVLKVFSLQRSYQGVMPTISFSQMRTENSWIMIQVRIHGTELQGYGTFYSQLIPQIN